MTAFKLFCNVIFETLPVSHTASTLRFSCIFVVYDSCLYLLVLYWLARSSYFCEETSPDFEPTWGEMWLKETLTATS